MKTKLPLLLILFLSLNFSIKAQKSFVYFETAKSDLNKKGKQLLDSLSMVMTSNPNYTIEVLGHTDAIGGDSMNMVLSRNRANAVVNYFAAKAIDPSRITYKGYGKTTPIRENNTNIGRKNNRRVEIITSVNAKVNIKSVIETPVEVYERATDTTIFGPKGTIFHFSDCAFAPIDKKKIKYEFIELYSQDDIDKSQVQTLSTDGNCLTSAGMVSIKATYNGKELQPKCPVDIAMPAEVLDTAMRLYDGWGRWNLSKEQLEFDSTAITAREIQKIREVEGKAGKTIPRNFTPSKNYYRFRTMNLGGHNCDKIKGAFSYFKSQKKRFIKYPDFVFKIPRSGGNSVSVKSSGGFHNVYAERISKRKFFFPRSCMNDITVTANYSKKGKEFECKKRLDELKYKRFRNVYKFKKKWFVEVKK